MRFALWKKQIQLDNLLTLWGEKVDILLTSEHVYIYSIHILCHIGGGFALCLRFCLFGMQKQHFLAMSKKKGERKEEKHDQNWPFCQNCAVPQASSKTCLKWSQKMRPGPYMCVYIYMHTCCEVIIWATFGQFVCHYLGQICFFLKTWLVTKHNKNWGFSTSFWNKTLRTQILDGTSLSGPIWPYLCCNQLGPESDVQKWHFVCLFLLW